MPSPVGDNYICLLAEYFKNHWVNVNETLENKSFGVHIQVMQLTFEVNPI